MDNATTTTQVDPAVETYYNRVLLEVFYPNLIHNLFGKIESLPANTGNTMKWRRYNNLATATVPMLDDGIDPPALRMGKVDITAKVSHYGSLVFITDVVDMTVEDKIMNETAKKLAIQKDQTTDELVRDILVACASSTDCTGGTNGNTPTELAAAGINAVRNTLMGSDAQFITQYIKASTGQGTSPIGAAFVGLMHTDVITDLEGVSGFRNTVQYPAMTTLYPGEWGSTGNVRWLTSTAAHKDTSGANDEYSLIILGQEAYGVVNLEGGNAELIIKDFDNAGSNLRRYASMGWKMAFVARILNDSYMHLLNVTLA